MSKIGNILELFISVNGESKRLKKSTLNLDEKGVRDDKYYGKKINRSILITSKDSYLIAKESGINLDSGDLGENLLIDYNPYKLPLNSKLKIGDVVLEISQNCPLCKHLTKIDKNLPKLLLNDRGIFAKVIHGGNIKMGNEIYLLEH